MRRMLGVMGLVAVVAAMLAIGLAGTVFASDGNPDQGAQTQNRGEVCLNGGGSCGDCEPNEYLEPGPHGLADVAAAAEDTGTQNRGEACPCGDCVPNEYLEPGPHGAQKGVSD